MKRLHLGLLASSLLMFSACESLYPPTPRPDYAIRVVQTKNGPLAVAQPCPSWATEVANPYDNQPLPQFGCATAQNLAAMVENPNDLVQGRSLATTRGVTLVGSIRRYDNNQTRGLILPAAETSQVATSTAASTASAMSGDATAATATSPIRGASSSAP